MGQTPFEVDLVFFFLNVSEAKSVWIGTGLACLRSSVLMVSANHGLTLTLSLELSSDPQFM